MKAAVTQDGSESTMAEQEPPEAAGSTSRSREWSRAPAQYEKPDRWKALGHAEFEGLLVGAMHVQTHPDCDAGEGADHLLPGAALAEARPQVYGQPGVTFSNEATGLGE